MAAKRLAQNDYNLYLNYAEDFMINKSIILNIGSSCFVRCSGCYNHFADSIRQKNSISADAVIDFAVLLWQEGLTKITFGGGDPLSHSDIIPILRAVKGLGFRVHLDTVGTAFDQAAETIFYGRLNIPLQVIADIAPYVSVFGIPLDGSCQSIAQLFRKGRPNFFEEQFRIVRALSQAQQSVCINTVAHRGNIADLQQLHQLLLPLHIYKWQIFEYMPIGELGYKNRAQFELEEGEFEQLQSNMEALVSPMPIQFKSRKLRSDMYLIIDDAGTAWLPTQDDSRVIFGNICSHDSRKQLIKQLCA
jgi:MoaA/NifB/PqqE/SkfB family radical SAM enzyme